MPELPEVEVVRAGLAAHVLGASIQEVQVFDPRSLRRHVPGAHAFAQELNGLVIRDVARRGKYLWVLLGQAESQDILGRALVIHLGMSGQVLLKEEGFPQEKHLKVLVELELATGQSLQLRFVDQRIFGGMFLDDLTPTTNRAGKSVPAASASSLGLAEIPLSVAHIARDPLDPFFEQADVRAKMLRTSTAIKKLILDQSVISGVGNIYADEALWRARLHYAKPAKSVSATQFRELMDALHTVMGDALRAGGTSFDDLYVNVNGESGYFDRSLNAYAQEGKPCKRCLEEGRTSIMVREPFGGRSSFRCPYCQRKPRGIK